MSPLTMYRTTVFPWAFISTTPTATASRRTTNCPGASGTARKSSLCTRIGRAATSLARGTSTWRQRAWPPNKQGPQGGGPAPLAVQRFNDFLHGGTRHGTTGNARTDGGRNRRGRGEESVRG